ncbi:uroporphyrinogen-III synthase [Arthrobacter alpinus]|uniref:uroporphyrinogen-III synthase n=1 Tax=Arthrobacter alpinus TaxID=656366 RepID=UPI000782D19D|nr:uroporphyrinogen-III synthase [Arthrobacter alpinus]
MTSSPTLSGRRIGVTAHRKAEELIGALERHGSAVLHAPALKSAPVQDDAQLLAETCAIIAAKPEIVMLTTAYGLRRWVDSAAAAGLEQDLLGVLCATQLYVRGPKARGAARAYGLADVGISPDETTSALTELVIRNGVGGGDLAGRTVALQLHGATDASSRATLSSAGAVVLTVSPYRWVSAQEGDRLSQLISAVCAHELDAVTFTSAPAFDAVLSVAQESGLRESFIQALVTGVHPVAVGPVTAQPLYDLGLTPWVPERFRMGAMVKLLVERLGPCAGTKLL